MRLKDFTYKQKNKWESKTNKILKKVAFNFVKKSATLISIKLYF